MEVVREEISCYFFYGFVGYLFSVLDSEAGDGDDMEFSLRW